MQFEVSVLEVPRSDELDHLVIFDLHAEFTRNSSVSRQRSVHYVSRLKMAALSQTYYLSLREIDKERQRFLAKQLEVHLPTILLEPIRIRVEMTPAEVETAATNHPKNDIASGVFFSEYAKILNTGHGDYTLHNYLALCRFLGGISALSFALTPTCSWYLNDAFP